MGREGAITTLWFETAYMAKDGDYGWHDRVRLTIADGRIAAMETAVDPKMQDERHAIGLPGLCNLHSHAFQRAMAGLTEYAGPTQDYFWTCAYRNPAEMAEQIAAASAETGIGLTLLPVFYAHGDFGGAAPTSGQRRFLNHPDRFARLFDASARALSALTGAGLGLAPHSLRAITPDELAAILPLAEGLPIHIHAAEQQKEVAACLAWSQQRPVEWLLNHAAVDAHWCLVHATHMTEAETDRLARSGAVAGLCPMTEADLGDGVFPTARYIAAQGRIGIGTDSNILIDAAGELRLLEYFQRLDRRARNVLHHPARPSVGGSLFEAAFRGGRQALGVDTGTGAAADILSLDARHPALIGRRQDQILDTWIFATSSGAIDCVWRAGVKLVANGRHRHRDPIATRYRRVLNRLLGS